LLCFLGSGHWIGGTLFSRLIGSNAAVSVIGDDIGMRFEGPVSGVNLPFQRGKSLDLRNRVK
jgi:ribulose 1,5-bisphosphate synthetase/thiazole synthase